MFPDSTRQERTWDCPEEPEPSLSFKTTKAIAPSADVEPSFNKILPYLVAGDGGGGAIVGPVTVE